jgi:hypothetical protein
VVHGIPEDEHGVDGGLSNLSGRTDYGAVVILYELQQLGLFWIWVKGDKTVFQRHNLKIFAAERQYIVPASLCLPCTFLEFLRGQYFLFTGLLD